MNKSRWVVLTILSGSPDSIEEEEKIMGDDR